jgi:PAS domain S-box-containing protein
MGTVTPDQGGCLRGAAMTIDIRTLAIILGITHLLQVIIFAFHVSINRTSRGAGWWLLWSGTAAVAFVFVPLRAMPSLYHISIIAQNMLLTLAVTFLYIGIMRFLGAREHRGLVALILSVFLVVLFYFTYAFDDIAFRTVAISVIWAAIALLTAYSLLTQKHTSIHASATFLALVFLAHGCFFLFRAVLVITGVNVAETLTPSLFNVSAFLDGIIVSILWTCGIIIMVNQRANADIEEARSHFELLFNTSPDAVMITRVADDVIVNVNDGFTRLTGYPRDETLGKSSLDLAIWPNPAVRQQVVAALCKHGICESVEVNFQRNDGSLAIGSLSANLFDLHGRPHIISVIRDITARKRAEDAATREQLLTNTIIDSIPGTFYMIGADGRYVRWNAYQRDEIVGGPDALVASTHALDTIHPDDRALVESAIEKVLARGTAETIEGRVLLHGGPAARWMLMTGRQLMVEGRSFLIGIGIDITEWKRAEAERETLYAQLAQARKMESVGRLAGGVAHHFNNMLGAILGFAELARNQVDPADPLYADLTEITRAATQSADMTRQLLAYARKQIVNPKVLHLDDAVAAMLHMLQHLIGVAIELVWRPGAASWPVHIDPSQVDQLLVNLCLNARDAIAGGGRITIETHTVTLDERTAAALPECHPGDYLLLIVSDTGRGMDAEMVANLFEPFFTTKGVGESPGLGLATVYGIVMQNHGCITVASELEHGTTFSIYLPRHQETN